MCIRDRLVPGPDERYRSVLLKAGGQGIDIDAGLGELGEDFLAVTAVGRHDGPEPAVVRQGFQGPLRYGVDRERRGERRDVEHVGRLRVLGAGAGPVSYTHLTLPTS